MYSMAYHCHCLTKIETGRHDVVETIIGMTASCSYLALVDIAYLELGLLENPSDPRTSTALETFTSQEHASTALNGASEERKKPARRKKIR